MNVILNIEVQLKNMIHCYKKTTATVRSSLSVQHEK